MALCLMSSVRELSQSFGSSQFFSSPLRLGSAIVSRLQAATLNIQFASTSLQIVKTIYDLMYFSQIAKCICIKLLNVCVSN